MRFTGAGASTAVESLRGAEGASKRRMPLDAQPDLQHRMPLTIKADSVALLCNCFVPYLVGNFYGLSPIFSSGACGAKRLPTYTSLLQDVGREAHPGIGGFPRSGCH